MCPPRAQDDRAGDLAKHLRMWKRCFRCYLIHINTSSEWELAFEILLNKVCNFILQLVSPCFADCFFWVSFRAMWQSRPTSLTEWKNNPPTSIGLLMFQLVSLRYGYEWFMAKKLASAKTGGAGEWRSLFTDLRTPGFLRYFPWDMANVMGWMLSDWWWCKRNVVYCTLSLSHMWQHNIQHSEYNGILVSSV